MKIARLPDGPEIFASIQGEGKTQGRPSVFVRTSHCNLYCVWCDTGYTWNWLGTPFKHVRDRKYDPAQEVVEMSPAEVARAVRSHSCTNVVLTGGEPLLQHRELAELMRILREADERYRFEVETNGTLVPGDEFASRIDQYNVSPKLSNSGIEREKRISARALEYFAASPKAGFKFVVSTPEDLGEVLELVRDFRLRPGEVCLMPEGTRSEDLRERGRWLVGLCKTHGFAFTDRLHIHQFGEKRGV